jgi:hypothetical protein
MESLVKYVLGEMNVIAHAPVTIVAALLIVAGVIWWAMDWRYSGIIANRDAELSSARTQRDEYKEKLQGATPDQAKARIDELEARLSSISPRRLNDEQRAALTAKLKLPLGVLYPIALTSEASGDSPQFEADFSAVFRAAGGWKISEPSVMGIGNRPPHGIAVRFADLNKPPPEATIVMDALRSINLPFDVQQGGNPIANIELLICTKIVR